MAEVFSYANTSISTPQAPPTSDGMVRLEIRLFGPMEVHVSGQPLPRLRSRKGLWLLALLALRAGRDVDRDWLAGVLWPEHREDAARRSLRQSLHDLRSALGPDAAARLSCESPRSLRLDLAAGNGVWADVCAFDGATNRIATATPDALETAVSLHRGPLLHDCAEDWVLEERREREMRRITALERLAELAGMRGDARAAADYLSRALDGAPLREDLLRAQMTALAASGSVGAALEAFRAFRNRLRREVRAEPDGKTLTLYQKLRKEGERGEAHVLPVATSPPLPVATPPTFPRQRTALVGRDTDAVEVAVCVARATLVTLTGTGGVGKTRLALRVAGELGGGYDGGAVFTDLAPLPDDADVSEVVRKALEIPEPGVGIPTTEAVARSIGQRSLLLVLDNCEQVCGSVARFTDTLLSRCPGVRVLATSRHALGLRGEIVWRVPSLPVPPPNTPAEELADYAAVRLFAERAADAEPGFAVTGDNAEAVAHVCRRLDGIPLALELAAARVRALSPAEIASRLDNVFRLLIGGDRSALPRQQTLRGAIEWSWNLLTEAEKTLLARLSVFVGGWTLPAAEAVCVDDGETLDVADVLDLLIALVDKSVVVAEKRVDGTTRYRLLETVREYARERLADREGQYGVATLHDRHQAYFAAFAEREVAAAEVTKEATGAGAGVLIRLEAEEDNLRAALDWRGVPCGPREETALRVLELAGALGGFWVDKQRVREGLGRVRDALRFADEVCVDTSRPVFEAARTKARRREAALLWQTGDYAAARAIFEEVLTEYRARDDRLGAAQVLQRLGAVARFQGDYGNARVLVEDGLALSREAGDIRLSAQLLTVLGVICAEQGDLAGAFVFQREALAIFQQIGDTGNAAKVMNNLGNALHEAGDYAAARALLEEVLTVQRRLGNRRSVAVALINLGGCSGDMGDYAAANRQLEEAMTLFREAGSRDMIGAALTAFGIVARKQGEHARARALLREGLTTHRESASPSLVANSLLELAFLNAARGEHETAMRLWGAAEARREAIGSPLRGVGLTEFEAQLAPVRAALGDTLADSLWAEGRAMTEDDAYDLAMFGTTLSARPGAPVPPLE